MRRFRIFSALLAVVAICAAAAPSAGAQAAVPAVREKAAPRPAVHPAAAQRTSERRDTAQASKSVSQRLFEARWVIFPARLALVIVFVTVALLLLLCGAWSAVRVAHSLRHTKWSEPPRRLKRGEVGAAGTTMRWSGKSGSAAIRRTTRSRTGRSRCSRKHTHVSPGTFTSSVCGFLLSKR